MVAHAADAGADRRRHPGRLRLPRRAQRVDKARGDDPHAGRGEALHGDRDAQGRP